MRRFILVLTLALWPWCAALAQGDPQAGPPAHAAHAAGQDTPGHEHPAPDPAPPPEVGVSEKLGAYLPEDVVLRDEEGGLVNLRKLVTMPTILAPVYYSCPNECNLLQGSLAQALPQIGLTPGKDYQVISVSFDENDSPAAAKSRKQDYLTALARDFPPEDWRFLTGDAANIRRLMDAIGFGFRREGSTFKHSVVLVAVSPEGKITRYLYGVRPLAFDITMAVTDAAEGRLGLSVKRAVAFCYSYDPVSRRYVFDLMKVAGVSVLAGISLFALFLALGGKKKGKRP